MGIEDDVKSKGDGRVLVARLAQGLAGGVTVWAVVVHLLGGPHTSALVLVLSAAALALSFKKTDHLRVRAFFCFSAAGLVNSLVLVDVALALLQLVLPGRVPRLSLTLDKQLLLAAAALYSFAGAFFWLAANHDNPTDEA